MSPEYRKIVIALIIGLISSAIITSIFWYISQEKKEVSFGILSETKVFSVDNPLSKLDVLYDGESLLEKDLALTAINIQFENTGNYDFAKTDFEKDEPLGVKIVKSNMSDEIYFANELPIIIEIYFAQRPEIIDDSLSDDYISKLPKLIFNDSIRTSFTFEPFFFNADKYFQVSLIIIHSKEIKPSEYVKSSGLIRGYEVQELLEPKKEFSVFTIIVACVICIFSMLGMIGMTISKIKEKEYKPFTIKEVFKNVSFLLGAIFFIVIFILILKDVLTLF